MPSIEKKNPENRTAFRFSGFSAKSVRPSTNHEGCSKHRLL